ncbi:MAG: phosphoribosylglycinamide formyltransferase [Oscillospiraceae bacterium]|nr:phosphoribosylglycinamide formyltransferase [Oscillospiraceae bacterium]
MLSESRKLRTAVLVSGGGTNLQAILDARGTVIQSAEIALVVSNNPGAYALERARQAGIPALTLSAKVLGGREAFELALQKALEAHEIRLIVLAGFLTILSPDFTRRWDHRILNVHPSLIPAFCGKDYYGLRVHEAALARGVKLTGATVHFVNEIPDGGEIILQKAVAVQPGDTPEKLQRRVMEEAEWLLLPQAIEQVAASCL